MYLYVIRHGETQWNVERRLAGRSDVPINERGAELAEITAQGLKDVHFDLCISSPLKRAMQTAAIILKGRDLPLITDKRLQEIDFGIIEGVSCINTEDAELKAMYLPFQKDPMNFKGMPGGESIKDVIKRASEVFDEIRSDPKLQDKTILISTHGCLYRAFLNRLYDDPSNFWQSGVPKNCAVTVVEIKDGKASITENDRLFYDPSLALKYF